MRLRFFTAFLIGILLLVGTSAVAMSPVGSGRMSDSAMAGQECGIGSCAAMPGQALPDIWCMSACLDAATTNTVATATVAFTIAIALAVLLLFPVARDRVARHFPYALSRWREAIAKHLLHATLAGVVLRD
jgi:hypothetical protein